MSTHPRNLRFAKETTMWYESDNRLHTEINALNENDREILVLRHFEELTNTEAATELGITPAAASKRYVRALERLREKTDLGDE